MCELLLGFTWNTKMHSGHSVPGVSHLYMIWDMEHQSRMTSLYSKERWNLQIHILHTRHTWVDDIILLYYSDSNLIMSIVVFPTHLEPDGMLESMMYVMPSCEN